MYDPTQFFHYFFFAMSLAVSLSACFCPWLLFCFKALELGSGKKFFRLLAGQTSALSLICALLFSIPFLGMLGYNFYKISALPSDIPALLPSALSLLLFILLLALLRLLRFKRVLQGWPQLILALLAASCGIYAACAVFRLSAQTPRLLPEEFFRSLLTWIWTLYPPGIPNIVSTLLMFGKILGSGLGLGMNLILCWLLLRRERDNYGRDYYNFAVRHGAVWLVLCTTLAAVCGLGMQILLLRLDGRAFTLNEPELWISSLLHASCIAFWVLIARSHTPLRHKSGIWISFPALFLSLSGHILFLRNFYFGSGIISDMIPSL
jgi:hypothetical protein